MSGSADRQLLHLTAVSNALRAQREAQEARWIGSPFEWITRLPSRTRGAVGEELVSQWLAGNGLAVAPPLSTGHDRVIHRRRMEIKLSTLWQTGVYTFQQFRDQDYDAVFCLGLSPDAAHGWVLPKTLVLQQWRRGVELRPQHGGEGGSDTAWLAFPPNAPPAWLQGCGGSLEQALAALRALPEPLRRV